MKWHDPQEKFTFLIGAVILWTVVKADVTASEAVEV